VSKFKLAFILLLLSMSSAFNVQPVRASGTIYIRADGSVDPPTASISTVDNLTYTLTGDILFESIAVERDNIVVDGAGYKVLGTNQKDTSGISLSRRRNVTIKNMEIKWFCHGILLYKSSNSRICGNNITANYEDGIRFNDSYNSSLTGNSVEDNGCGICLDLSSNNTIRENYIAGNGDGIWLRDFADDNNVYGNNITANSVSGIHLDSSSNRISCNNIANNSVGVELMFAEIPTGLNQIHRNNITDNWEGIYLHELTGNNSIHENNVSNNRCGIQLCASSNNTISGNQIEHNEEEGIFFELSSRNVLRNNTIAGSNYNLKIWGETFSDCVNDVDASNTVNGKPIYYWINKQDMTVPLDAGFVALINCTNITVQNLSLTKNWHGVLLLSTTNSTITRTNVTDNRFGIWVTMSSHNNITSNNIADNGCGIHIRVSSSNSIHHNNFIDNTQQVSSIYSVNVWDDGVEGNYWSNYEQKYPNATEIDDSGIWDTPYVIDEINQDHYPIVTEFPSLLILPIFIMTTLLAVTVYKRKQSR